MTEKEKVPIFNWKEVLLMKDALYVMINEIGDDDGVIQPLISKIEEMEPKEE